MNERSKKLVNNEREQEYQISARKWRPQTFDEVVGQEVIKRELKNGLLRKKIANAYLFSGPRGVGKTSMARIFAKALNCVNGPSPDPCNVCDQCVSITKGSALDIIEIDGASYTKVENIRDLQEGVSRAPYSARYKVYIIDEVHMLSISAFNALLKTLEEPPPFVVFIFATTNPEKIPETVVSRCRHYEFRRIETGDIIRNLEQIIEREKDISIAPPEKRKILEAIALSAEGGLRDAQVTLDQLLTLGDREITFADVEQLLGIIDVDVFFQIISGIIKKDTKSLILLVNQIVERGRDIERLIKSFVQFIRDLMILRAGGDYNLVSLYGESLNYAKKITSQLPYPFLLNLLHQFFLLEEKLKTSALPSRFLLEFTLVKLTAIEPAIDIDRILKELKYLPDSSVIPDASSQPLLFGDTLTTPDDNAYPLSPSSSLNIIDEMESSPLQSLMEKSSPISDLKTSDMQIKSEHIYSKPPQKPLQAVEIWDSLKKEIKQHNMLIFSAMQDISMVEFGNNILKIWVPEAKKLTKNVFDKKENRDFIEETLKKLFGIPIHIEVIIKKSEGAVQLNQPEAVKDDTSTKEPTGLPKRESGISHQIDGASRIESSGLHQVSPTLKTEQPYRFDVSPKNIVPEIQGVLIKETKEDSYGKKYETFSEAYSKHPDFREKVDLVVKLFDGKVTQFNKKPIK